MVDEYLRIALRVLDFSRLVSSLGSLVPTYRYPLP